MLATLEGRLLGIDGVRQSIVDEKSIRFSKAVFQVSFGLECKMGTMIFWNEEVNVLLRLRLGQDYQFIAGVEIEEDLFLLYFLPSLTRFEESMKGEKT